MSDPAGAPSADDALDAVAAAVEDVPIPMEEDQGEEEFVFRVGCRTLLLSAIALTYALAVAGGTAPPVPACHLLLLFLLWALALGLVYASMAALRGFPRTTTVAVVAVARTLHRLFWEQRR